MTVINFISSPISHLEGEITVPGDKSISHRAIILSAIAKGTSTVYNFLEGEDCLKTLQAFHAMGVSIERPSPSTVRIHGVGKYGLQKPTSVINCGNSGTTIRLLTGLLAALPFDSVLTGDESLRSRPMERIQRPLIEMGADIVTHNGKAPIQVRGGRQLKGIRYEMPIASAQLKTCLLLAGLYASGETTIIEPLMTRDHTERMLTAFSYPIQKSDNIVSINSHSTCLGTDIRVPGDLSSAAFLIVAATIVPGSKLLIRDVGINPTRTGILEILWQMGAKIEILNKRLYGEEVVADLFVEYSLLEGIEINSSLVPLAIDEFPIIFIAAAVANGQTRLQGADELRRKESDRIASMVTGLQQLGIDAKDFGDGVHIHGGVLQGGLVDSYGDHRVAMAFAIAGAVAKNSISIQNCAQVVTSFPNFVNTANAVRMNVMEVHVNER